MPAGRRTRLAAAARVGASLGRNLDVIRDSGRAVDMVCFTGDAAFTGRDHYDSAAEFLRATLGRLNVPLDRFFAVPGNHDVNRDHCKPAWRNLRKKISDVEPVQLSAWLTAGQTPRGLRSATLNQVLERSAEFWRWLDQDMGRADLLPSRSPHGRLGYRSALELPGIPFPIHIIGLDTAWLCGDDNDAGKLRLTDGQIGLLADERLIGFKTRPGASSADRSGRRTGGPTRAGRAD